MVAGVLAALGAASAFAQVGPRVSAGSVGGSPVDQFSQATGQLYGRIEQSLIRVHIDQSPAAMLPAPMRGAYQDWRRSQSTDDPSIDGTRPTGGGGGRRGGGPPRGGNGGGLGGGGAGDLRGMGRGDAGGGRRGFGLGGSGGPSQDDTAGRGGPQSNPAQLRRFVEQQISALADKDPNQAAALRGLLFRIDAVRAGVTGDLYGIVIDDKGTAIVLTALLREAQPESLKVTGPDGIETTARFIGTQPQRGYTIIQLDKPEIARPVPLAEGRPPAGALLLSIGATSGATGWVVAPAKFGKRAVDDRIPLFAGDDRGGSFVFDDQGRLAALGWGRFALPLEQLQRDIQWIVKNGKDVTPRELGVRYSRVAMPNSPPRNPRDAARVDAVAPNSPAARAGLQPNDIVVSIDGRPINQLPQIQMDLATRSGSVPMGIFRNGKEMKLDLPLDAP